MAGSVNRVTILGNLGADPEVRSFQNGGRIANMRIATSESWKDKNTGERQDRTEWHSVAVTTDGLVGVVERYLRKGSKVYIEGQLRTRKWQDQSGNDRYTTEVVVGGPKSALVMLDSAGGGQHGDGRGDGGWGGGQREGGRTNGDGWNQTGSGRGGASGGGWDRNGGNRNGGQRGGWDNGGSSTGGGGAFDDLDDDIPF